MRVCSKCNTERSLECFYFRTGRVETVCKECCRAAAKICARVRRSKKSLEDRIRHNKANAWDRAKRWMDSDFVDERIASSHKSLVKSWVKELNSTRMNVSQAWRYWESIAPSSWMRQRYESKPWKNPRLSAAEKYKSRYQNDPEFNMKERIRNQIKKCERGGRIGDQIRMALKRDGNSPQIESLLGYSMPELKSHLESQFDDGMTWEAFLSGEIHIDHKHPKSQYDLSNTLELLSCWSLDNLQPMWAHDNQKKFTSIEHEKHLLPESALQMDMYINQPRYHALSQTT